MGSGALEKIISTSPWLDCWVEMESSRIKRRNKRNSQRAALFHLQFFPWQTKENVYNFKYEVSLKENIKGENKEIILMATMREASLCCGKERSRIEESGGTWGTTLSSKELQLSSQGSVVQTCMNIWMDRSSSQLKNYVIFWSKATGHFGT